MEAQLMESRASSRSSSRRMSTGTVPLMEGGMDGYGAPQLMTMTWTRNGASVRVSFPPECHNVKRASKHMCKLP